eukprot:3823620-Pleurochrysis_carterae.AAC.1
MGCAQHRDWSRQENVAVPKEGWEVVWVTVGEVSCTEATVTEKEGASGEERGSEREGARRRESGARTNGWMGG